VELGARETIRKAGFRDNPLEAVLRFISGRFVMIVEIVVAESFPSKLKPATVVEPAERE
jgi:hypothetical protein